MISQLKIVAKKETKTHNLYEKTKQNKRKAKCIVRFSLQSFQMISYFFLKFFFVIRSFVECLLIFFTLLFFLRSLAWL